WDEIGRAASGLVAIGCLGRRRQRAVERAGHRGRASASGFLRAVPVAAVVGRPQLRPADDLVLLRRERASGTPRARREDLPRPLGGHRAGVGRRATRRPDRAFERRREVPGRVTTLLLVGVIVVCFSFGDIALTRGMKQAGEISSLRLKVLDQVGGRAIRSPLVLLGGALQIIAFVTYLVSLSRRDLLSIFPRTATSDIVTTLAARYMLRERVTPTRWAGVVIVTLGIALISAS